MSSFHSFSTPWQVLCSARPVASICLQEPQVWLHTSVLSGRNRPQVRAASWTCPLARRARRLGSVCLCSTRKGVPGLYSTRSDVSYLVSPSRPSYQESAPATSVIRTGARLYRCLVFRPNAVQTRTGTDHTRGRLMSLSILTAISIANPSCQIMVSTATHHLHSRLRNRGQELVRFGRRSRHPS